MSNIERIDNLQQVISKLEPDFNALAQIHGAVSFKREASFAMQILKDNSFLMGIALENQDSLRMAVINVASVGLTLSPLKALAYLVPRKRKICLDISYRGFAQLAFDCRALQWVKAEIVHENDEYSYCGMGKEPQHIFTPFEDRGKIIGAYCVGKTYSNEFLIDHMTIDEIYNIRNRSESWRAFKKDSAKPTPWVTDEGEMIKKTVIRRASKMWPMVDSRERFDKALEVASDAEPVLLGPVIDTNLAEHIQGIARIQSLLHILGRTDEQFLDHLSRGMKRKIDNFDGLTQIEMKQAIAMLEGWISKKEKK